MVKEGGVAGRVGCQSDRRKPARLVELRGRDGEGRVGFFWGSFEHRTPGCAYKIADISQNVNEKREKLLKFLYEGS